MVLERSRHAVKLSKELAPQLVTERLIELLLATVCPLLLLPQRIPEIVQVIEEITGCQELPLAAVEPYPSTERTSLEVERGRRLHAGANHDAVPGGTQARPVVLLGRRSQAFAGCELDERVVLPELDDFAWHPQTPAPAADECTRWLVRLAEG